MSNNPEILECLLMDHLKSSEPDFIAFAIRAIGYLAKKLMDKPGEVNELKKVIKNAGDEVSRCVTIPRTKDGRIQVAERKVYPHVIYAKLWRWPVNSFYLEYRI